MKTSTPMMISRKQKARAGILDTAKSIGGAILRAPALYIDAVEKANKRHSDAMDNKEIADIERAFGSVDNYKKLDPLFRTRKEKKGQ